MTPATLLVSARAETNGVHDHVADPRPRLSWTLDEAPRGFLQTAAQVELDDGTTVTIDSDESVLVAWPFGDLAPRERRRLRVRVRGQRTDWSAWSTPFTVYGAFLSEGEWTAPFIGQQAPAEEAQPFVARRVFEVDAPLRAATLYYTARGAAHFRLNGSPIDDAVLSPGWTSYQFRILHDTADVTARIRPGRNVLGAEVAGAWYTEAYGFFGNAERFYGAQPEIAAQLLLEFEDGSTRLIRTDREWCTSGEGALRTSGIYAGETYDATRRLDGWDVDSFDDRAWPAAGESPVTAPIPTVRIAPPVRRIDVRAVQDRLPSASGSTILDFGQNLVGRLRLRVDAPRGTEIVLRHAEVLENGELGLRPLRFAAATDRYTARGESGETWTPQFTFHGFRYAQITGVEDDQVSVEAEIIHTDMRRTGWFTCSHEPLNRLHENVVWGMRGNFLSVPTDCPQRDERLGWTGDLQVFAPAAASLFDVDRFLASWLTDLRLEQDDLGTGAVPFVIPFVIDESRTLTAVWGDAATLTPWLIYERYRDVSVLETQFDSMRGWVDAVLREVGPRGLWEGGFQLGDWLDPDAPPDNPIQAKADGDLVANAYLVRSSAILAQAAHVLGRADVAAQYAKISETVREAFVHEYVTPGGRMMSDAPTAYALAIVFELTDPSMRLLLGERLSELVTMGAYRIGTGFVGTAIVTDALSATGHDDTASRMLVQTENPSWLYPVTMGATTVWERWDAMLEDGTINPGEMTSFNHYAFGAVIDWMHRAVAGLDAAEPGYRVLRVAPRFLDALDWAEASHLTPFGRASVSWRREGGMVRVVAAIPPNARALVSLPGRATEEVGSGDHEWLVQAPRSATGLHEPLTLATNLDRVVADADAYRASYEMMLATAGEISATQWRHMRWTSGRTLGEMLFTVTPAGRAAALSVLDAFNAGRG